MIFSKRNFGNLGAETPTLAVGEGAPPEKENLAGRRVQLLVDIADPVSLYCLGQVFVVASAGTIGRVQADGQTIVWDNGREDYLPQLDWRGLRLLPGVDHE